MPDRILPEAFPDLEPLVAWALPTEQERNHKRVNSSMTEINTFYETLLPRMDDVLAYLNQFSLDALPAEAQRLMYLTLSLAEVAPAVEFFHQPRVTDGYDPARFIPVQKYGAQQ